MKFIIMLIILCLASSAYARDPDVLPHDDEYGERVVVGGSSWSGGDTFICIALPIAVILTLALPHIFHGNLVDQRSILLKPTDTVWRMNLDWSHWKPDIPILGKGRRAKSVVVKNAVSRSPLRCGLFKFPTRSL